MKLGEIYKVIEGKENRGYKLEKVGSQSSVTLELPPEVHWLVKLYATILDDKVENFLVHMISQLATQRGEGWILGEEIAARYEEMTNEQEGANE